MKRNRDATIRLIVMIVFALGLLAFFFCPEIWQKILGLIISVISIVVAIEFISDNF